MKIYPLKLQKKPFIYYVPLTLSFSMILYFLLLGNSFLLIELLNHQALYGIIFVQLLFFIMQTIMLFCFLATVLKKPTEKLKKLYLKHKELAKNFRCISNTLIIKLMQKTNKTIDLSNDLLRNWDKVESLKKNYAKCKKIAYYNNLMLLEISDVNDFFTLNKKAKKIDNKFLNLAKLLNLTVEEAKIIHLNTGIFIETTIPMDLIFTAKIDEYLMKKCLHHIIASSVEFLNSYKITISLEEFPQYFQITIKNYGIEMPEKDLNEIFKPFYHSSISKKSANNFGLSLAIAEKIIKLHGGSISAKNNTVKALIISFSIPVAAKE
jgi:light-regulated signal transduction histidine kinase (bacteriophytochrome)